MPPRKDLGSILIDEDVLEAKDLERVALANNGRRPLWAVLLDAELVTAEQIFRAMSVRFGVPVVSDERLADAQVPADLKVAINRPQALAAGLLPIDLSADGQRATVVMIDPSDEQTLADFLTRAQVPEGRALLGRREAIARAIERSLPEATAIVAPLPPMRRRKTSPPPVTASKKGDDEVTGTVTLDPSLQAEIQRLPARLTQADPLTPLPRPRPRRPTPPAGAEPPRAQESISDALRAEERLTRALVEAVEALAGELESRLVGAGGPGEEMARLSRRVARQLGLSRRLADEIGVAALLFSLDKTMRAVEGADSGDVFAELGWAAAGDGGLLPILRALTAASAGFARPAPMGQPASIPIGARIIGAVADYQELGAAATAGPDLDTVSQLLRASPAGAQVVDALLRVLENERGDRTPASPTKLSATSMLRDQPPTALVDDEDDEPPTPPPLLSDPRERSDEEKTQRKPYPRKEGSKGE